VRPRLGRAALRRFRNPVLTIAALDAAALVAAFLLAVGLRFGFDSSLVGESLGPTWPRALSFTLWVVLGLLSMGLYRLRQRPTSAETVARVILGVALGGVGNVLFFYLIPDLTLGRAVMAIALAISSILLVITHLAILNILDESSIKRRVLVIGAGESAAKVGRLRRRSDRRRFEVVGFVMVSDAERSNGLNPVIGSTISLDEAAAIRDVDEVVVALDDRRGNLPVDFLFRTKQRGILITDIVDFLERETERLDLDILRPSWLLYERSSQAAIIYRWFKRFFDVVFAAVLLLVCLPVIVLVIVLIWFEDGIRLPVFYRQRRVGRNGRNFYLLKFRSMRVDAEKGTGPRFASSNDDRVTRVGRVIRRFRVDELPQMLNVIAGDMSIVGPRPERPEFVEDISRQLPLYVYRHGLRPGLTGWAQLNFPYGGSVEDAREKLSYDLYYIKNTNLVVDLLILLQTLEVVVWGRGTTMAGTTSMRRGE
jgi:sugar transferase (PEP-CTERM system associated)